MDNDKFPGKEEASASSLILNRMDNLLKSADEQGAQLAQIEETITGIRPLHSKLNERPDGAEKMPAKDNFLAVLNSKIDRLAKLQEDMSMLLEPLLRV